MPSKPEPAKKVRVKCSCGYAWDTSGKLMQVTCPSCGKKTPVPAKKGKDKPV